MDFAFLHCGNALLARISGSSVDIPRSERVIWCIAGLGFTWYQRIRAPRSASRDIDLGSHMGIDSRTHKRCCVFFYMGLLRDFLTWGYCGIPHMQIVRRYEHSGATARDDTMRQISTRIAAVVLDSALWKCTFGPYLRIQCRYPPI